MTRDYIYTFNQLKCLNLHDYEKIIPIKGNITERLHKLLCLNYLLCVNSALQIVFYYDYRLVFHFQQLKQY